MSRRLSPNDLSPDVLEKAKEQWYARVRKRNIGVFLGFFGLAASIYAFTIYRVGQESFLDEDFDQKTAPQNKETNI